jgi:hypothetical protein
VAIAERFLRRGLIDIEIFPRKGCFRWKSILERKEELAELLDGDWFMHVDADEIRLPLSSSASLLHVIQQADQGGFNAINFLEYTFVPTVESPDHDHPNFQRTMRWYYPFLPAYPHRLNTWKRQLGRVDLASSGGHKVHFQELRMYPESCPMRHYLFLSLDHAIKKYIHQTYDPIEMEAGWHRARAGLQVHSMSLQRQGELRTYISDGQFDSANPCRKHPIFQQ